MKPSMFKFSIRDVLWVTLVVGLALALWMEHGRLKREAAMWEKHAKYWRGNAEVLAEDLLTVDPTRSTTFDGIPPTPENQHEVSRAYSADTLP